MTSLAIYSHSDGNNPLWQSQDGDEIQQKLSEIGVRFARWQTSHALSQQPSQQEVITAYQPEIDKLVAQEGYQSWDVASVHHDTPQKQQLRAKFLAEHTHTEDEVRFFVEGSGLFYLHLSEQIFRVFCEKGDLLSVPANTPHWFDMGSQPSFTAIRLFNNPKGWQAQYTGDDITTRYPILS
jgi:1,2-dihydroxy-3-keto-5-methylthiopentene dioxygenase